MNISALLSLLAQQQGNGLPGVPRPAPSAPIPFAPVPNLGPLRDDTTAAFAAQNPEPVPPRFIQPAQPDQGFVNTYTGPAPTPPPARGKVERIFNALAGFGAGFQGQGAQYIESLRAPQRAYERQREGYEDRRARGIELAERRAEREAEQLHRANQSNYENQYREWLRKNDVRDDAGKQRVAQMFTLERDARAALIEEQREQRRERRQKEVEARQITERYFTATKNRALSVELGRHWSGLSDAPLSLAAARLDAQLQGVGEVRMRRAAGTGGGGGGSSSAVTDTLREFEALKTMAMQGVKAAGGTPAEEIEAVRRATLPVVRRMARQPRLFEVGSGEFGFLYAKPREGAPAPAQQGGQPQGQTRSMAQIRALAQQVGITEAEAVQRAVASGYQITP